jgi:outer membrane lipoprotein-sorting protein
MWVGFAVVTAAAVLAATSAGAWADQAAEQKGAELMDKFVEVTGGKAAYEAIKSRIVKAEATMPGGGMTGKMEVHAAYPDKFRASVEMPGGNFERGSDGKTVWISHPSFGASILEGADRVSAIRESTQDRFGQWRRIYEKAEYTGDGEVNGAACSKVVLTLKPIDPNVEEAPVTAYIAKDSGLIVKWTTQMTTPQGELEVDVRLGDYKKVGDVLIPHTMKVSAQGLEQSVTVQEMQVNVEIPVDKFELPEAVKAQLESK